MTGSPTFMAAPEATSDGLFGADLAVLDVPLGGLGDGPATVRAASHVYAGQLAAASRATGMRFIDYGDVAVDAGDVGVTFLRPRTAGRHLDRERSPGISR